MATLEKTVASGEWPTLGEGRSSLLVGRAGGTNGVGCQGAGCHGAPALLVAPDMLLVVLGICGSLP